MKPGFMLVRIITINGLEADMMGAEAGKNQREREDQDLK